ncbi:hypothetical protein [Verrucosispora sioxanthis]|uniref:hypothetical protein n=1 Tax=Verrucosispora sioxanthis TaxID=2499994 RepID=UPI00209E87C8|nr:hypothetical protein [Verrucosispora sioxanthis]
MEKTVLYQFLIEVPRAAAIWSVLLVLALGVLTVLVARPEPAGPVEKTTDQDAVRAATEEADLRRYAGETGLSAPRTPRTPAEYAARERWLHRAAMAAHWRGDLTARQLTDVLAHRSGWDPRRHPAEQEAVLARVVRDNRLAAYRSAAERERDLWRAAELATEAARSLSAEAYARAAPTDPTARLRSSHRRAARPGPALASGSARLKFRELGHIGSKFGHCS